MSVFSTLREFLSSLAGRNESETRELEEKASRAAPVAKPVLRNQGDAFDAGPRGRRVDLSGGLNAPLLELEEPRVEDSFIPPSGFNASLEDLPALVDEPLGEQPEFIPEGGMSTQSLMREFDVLDPSIIPAPAEPVSTFFESAALEESSFEPAPVVAVQPGADSAGAPSQQQPAAARAPTQLAPELAAAPAPAQLDPAPAPTQLAPELAAAPAPARLDPAPAPAQLAPEFAAAPAPAQLSPELAAAPAPAQLAPELDQPTAQSQQRTAATPAASAQAERLALKPSAPAQSAEGAPERLAPAWLIKPTTAAPKPTGPSTGVGFNASLEDLGLLSDEPAHEPETPPAAPSGQTDGEKR